MEYLDVVDKDDHVICRASKTDIYKKRLPHRIVHILIFNKRGQLLLQMRSKECSYKPLHWATSAAGHVRSGEDCEKAALREYEEELGTKSELEFFAKDFYQASDSPDKFLVTFKTVFEGPFKPDPHAVADTGFFSLDEIHRMIGRGEKMHPELMFLLKTHWPKTFK